MISFTTSNSRNRFQLASKPINFFQLRVHPAFKLMPSNIFLRNSLINAADWQCVLGLTILFISFLFCFLFVMIRNWAIFVEDNWSNMYVCVRFLFQSSIAGNVGWRYHCKPFIWVRISNMVNKMSVHEMVGSQFLVIFRAIRNECCITNSTKTLPPGDTKR